MDILPIFLLKFFEAVPRRQEGRGIMYIIIRQPFDFLEEGFRRAFEGQENIRVIMDRRSTRRRTSQQPVAVERRGTDQRRPKEEIGEVVISEIRGSWKRMPP